MSEALEIAIEAFHNVYDGAEFASVDRAIKAAIDEYIRQHDDHAEFVWAVRKQADFIAAYSDGYGNYEVSRDAAKIVDLCDAELAKEQPK
jgi:hypothetical protein